MHSQLAPKCFLRLLLGDGRRLEGRVELRLIRHRRLRANAILLEPLEQIVEELPTVSGVILDHLIAGPVEILDPERFTSAQMFREREFERAGGDEHRAGVAGPLPARRQTVLQELRSQIDLPRQRSGLLAARRLRRIVGG